MKNLILLIFLLFTSCVIFNKSQSKNQKANIPEYLSLEELKGDTVAYIIQSIYERKDYYIGKKGKVLFKDLELEIVDDVPDLAAGSLATALYVGFYFIERNTSLTRDAFYNKPLKILVNFEVPPALYETIQEMPMRTKDEWTKEEYNFYKNLIVRDIVIPNFGVFRKYFEEK